jgi:hypothetical protein
MRATGPGAGWIGGRPRTPFTQAAVVGLAGHVFYELGSGVGMPLASLVGPRAAAALWGSATVVTLRRVRRPDPDPVLLGSVNSMGLAAVVAHFAAWPRRRTRLGLPYLTECEGLGRDRMPAYNLILYLSAAAALGGLAVESREDRTRSLRMSAAAVPVLMAGQRWEFRRLQRLAWSRPGWWNRRLRREHLARARPTDPTS